jgi:hypothetical protein
MTLLFQGRIFFQKMPRIQQDDFRQVGGCAGRQDRMGISLFDETGNQARMVQMGMSQQQEIDLLGGSRERPPVAFQIGPFLEKPAVDEQLQPSGFQIIAGTRDLAVGPQKLDPHGFLTAGRKAAGP